MKYNLRRGVIIVLLFISFFSVNGLGRVDSYAAVKAPGKVGKLLVDDNETYLSESFYVSEVNSSWNERTVLGIVRIVDLKWKKVKGADGYKIYMSTKSAKKGFKCVRTVGKNGFWSSRKGYIDSGGIEYTGSKKAQVWFKVRAYKKNGEKIKYGKYSKPLKVVLLQRPIITYLKGQGNEVALKWNKVYLAKEYEVLIAASSDISEYLDKYNKEHPNSQLGSKSTKAFLAVAKPIVTTNKTSCKFILPKEGYYYIHVRAVNGKDKSGLYWPDYVYYDWWPDE